MSPGQKLRLRPATSSWLGLDGGLARSQSAPGGDPTAPGPWALAEGGPEGTVVALLQTRDFAVWAATEHELHRFDGQAWTQVLADLPTVHCLAEDGDGLLIGTDAGLRRLEQHPEGEPAVESSPASTTPSTPCSPTAPRGGSGPPPASSASKAPTAAPFELTGTPVFALARDRGGVVYAGTELGLFQRQPGSGHWYWYAGADASDQVPDWQRFLPAAEGDARNFPDEEDVFLPPVRAVHRAPDASLWIGTEAGLARYVARQANGLAYTTVLEAFPDLGTGPVHAIAEDARGLVWFGTDRGLLRYDGRDLWEFQSEAGWVQLGRADHLYGDAVSRTRLVALLAQLRTVAAAPALRRGCRSPPSRARPTSRPCERSRGRTRRSPTSSATASRCRSTRPSSSSATSRATRGSSTAACRRSRGCRPGTSTWRYLALEGEGTSEPEQRPAWTREGRLLPPPPDRDGRVPGPLRPVAAAAREPVRRRRLRVPAGRARPLRMAARARPLSVLARLRRRAPDEHLEPTVLDRVFQGLDQVRPAGVNAALAVDEEIVRGGAGGPVS